MGTTETLRTLLDGRYPETQDRVRWWLSQPGNEPVDDLPMEEHREKVLAWARELSSQGDTAMGYPVQYGARTPSVRGWPRSRRSPWAICRCWSSAASSSGCSAGRSCTSERRS